MSPFVHQYVFISSDKFAKAFDVAGVDAMIANHNLTFNGYQDLAVRTNAMDVGWLVISCSNHDFESKKLKDRWHMYNVHTKHMFVNRKAV